MFQFIQELLSDMPSKENSITTIGTQPSIEKIDDIQTAPTSNIILTKETKILDDMVQASPATLTTKHEQKPQLDENIIRVHINSSIEVTPVPSTERHSTPEVTCTTSKTHIIQEIQSLTQLNNLRFSEILSSHARSLEMNRKAIKIPQTRPRECEAFRIIRCSGSSCSKDTLSYIDQNGHGLLDDDDDDEDDICSKQSALWVG